ncbi:M48 family metalloprotease [Phycisphaera mikurensis]|uniref:M48 family metalloprotease n=1 Tax=Phycisphaera mikurensis TaxID=547188 RepID=UPI00059DED66|nr:M48 family metalloprotease [Phycisphaera mikurensis]MBB6440564.1 Zn-dependent protease with chaperone function [Phycisphaera mikurensis]
MLLLGAVLLLALTTDFGVHAQLAAAGWVPADPLPAGPLVLGLCLGAVVVPHALAGTLAARRLGTAAGAGRRWLALHERLAAAAPPLLLLGFAAGLACGWAEAVRAWIGDPWIFDDAILLAPPLAATALMDAAAWPLVRRFREATLLGRADAGLPIHPVPGRWAYVGSRFRGGVGILGVPLALVLGWNQALEAALAAAPDGSPLPPPGSSPALLLAAAGSLLAVALCPPLLVRVVPTMPLPIGPLRDELLAFLAAEKVRARRLRVWLTGSAVANAALVGPLPCLRYLMLSDRLLESLPREELLGVLAHETGHARHRHLLWLGGWAIASAVLLALTLDAAVPRLPVAAEWPLVGLAVAAWAAAFGWVSRRVEAQADAHAAAAMSDHLGPATPDAAAFTPAGVAAIADALARVARLAGSSQRRRSFRHGSIASRRAALLRLLHRPDEPAAADRAMTVVKLGAVACVLLSIGLGLLARGPWI